MMKKVLFAALMVLVLAVVGFVLLYDWDEPSHDPRMMGGPHLGTPAQSHPGKIEQRSPVDKEECL